MKVIDLVKSNSGFVSLEFFVCREDQGRTHSPTFTWMIRWPLNGGVCVVLGDEKVIEPVKNLDAAILNGFALVRRSGPVFVNNNNDDDVYGVVLMTVVTVRVHPVHLTNAD